MDLNIILDAGIRVRAVSPCQRSAHSIVDERSTQIVYKTVQNIKINHPRSTGW